MLENMRIFIPKKMRINRCVKMPVGFTNVAKTTALTSKFVDKGFLSNHVLCATLLVQVVVLATLVKPTGIFTHV